jgi:hypothetical protein
MADARSEVGIFYQLAEISLEQRVAKLIVIDLTTALSGNSEKP